MKLREISKVFAGDATFRVVDRLGGIIFIYSLPNTTEGCDYWIENFLIQEIAESEIIAAHFINGKLFRLQIDYLPLVCEKRTEDN